MKKNIVRLILIIALFSCATAWADLSAKAAFTLLEKVPPGEDYSDAKKFLGPASNERTVDAEKAIKVARWGKTADSWIFEVLHDQDQVRATRIIWKTASKSDQQRIFSQITTAGKNFFGGAAKFKGSEEAQWDDFGGRWITRAKIESDLKNGVTLLSGIRDPEMGSDRYGF